APRVLVDYAHTDDALDNALGAVRRVAEGRLTAVFGCGGDRDRTKRPRMAAVACRWADRVVITSDNPRTEDPRRILADILEGVPADRQGDVLVEPDRAAAIAMAIARAGDEETIVLAGKGHEDYQILSDGRGGVRKIAFDDRLHAAEALRQRRLENIAP
ncbi:MAG: glutamate ligase domain-containing protein, partial [Planctomycetota bacterium]